MTRSLDIEFIALLHEGAAWDGFLHALRARCGAERAFLYVGAETEGVRRFEPARLDPPNSPPPAAFAALRPNRAYGFDEITPAPADGAFGRVMRVNAGTWSAWLLIARDATDFTAADSALLSALAPHLTSALANFAAFEHERRRAARAEALLARAGISVRPAGADVDDSAILHLANERVAVTRQAKALGAPHARQFASAWRLSEKEGSLAIAIANGDSLTEAADALGLTIETARNYSKRVYAKTGAKGLADLVRIVLTSPAALA